MNIIKQEQSPVPISADDEIDSLAPWLHANAMPQQLTESPLRQMLNLEQKLTRSHPSASKLVAEHPLLSLASIANIQVVKIGGDIAENNTEEVAQAIAEATLNGKGLLVVHGAQNNITTKLNEAQVPFEIVNGVRKTSVSAGAVIQDALNEVGEKLTGAIKASGVPVTYLPQVLQGTKHMIHGSQPVEDCNVATNLIIGALLKGDVVVAGPMALTSRDESMNWQEPINVNACTAAGLIVKALVGTKGDTPTLSKVTFTSITKTGGILIGDEVADFIHVSDLKKQVAQGQVTNGMLPKTNTGTSLVEMGVISQYDITGIEGLKQLLQGKMITAQGTTIYG